MLSALVYLQFQSIRNRLIERLRRLRRPRYLFGAIAGGLYLVIVIARPVLFSSAGGVSGHRRITAGVLPEVPANVWEFAAALALAIIVVLAWFIPQARAALVFTEAEIAFLFPAPIRRRTLIHYKLIRSQLGIFFTVFFLTLFTRFSGGVVPVLLRAAGWWVLLSTINLHLLGASFVRTMLLERGLTVARRRCAVGLIVITLSALAIWWTRGQVPPLGPGDTMSLGAFAHWLGIVAETAPAQWLLLPFRWVVRPFMASSDPAAFGAMIGPAVGVLALHYWWVVRSDVAFEEASIAASQRHATRVAAMRSGNWQNARPALRRRDPFRLAPTGPAAVAILWKNLLGLGQFYNARLGIAIVAWAAIAGSAFGRSGGIRTEWPLVIGWMCVMLLCWALLLGPQLVRQDFRRDLAVADLLKCYPVKGWQLALGELLAPVAILTMVDWVLIVLAATLLHASPAGHAALLPTPSHALAVAVLCPAFNVVSLLVPNAAALLLPGWFALPAVPGAAANSRGIEVLGQRLLFLAAQLLVLALALVPAIGVFALMYFLVLPPHVSEAIAGPLSALAAASVFAAEGAVGVAVLGRWFDEFDVSEERI